MNRIITIGREFGSGGRELGRRLSEKLHIAYYDQEIITEIAKRTSMSEEYVRQITESRPIMSFPIHVRHSFYPIPNPAFMCYSGLGNKIVKQIQVLASPTENIKHFGHELV